jgi:hypothetical protein
VARSAIAVGSEPGLSLPIVDRLAAPPSRSVVVARIERHTESGDVVADLYARGGWIARAAIERNRQAMSFESGPLARLVAEIVLRPPDVRQLDAAFQRLGAAAHGKTNLRLAIADLYATNCATCDRSVIAEHVTWEAPPARDAEALPKPILKHYRCPGCSEQGSGSELREAPVDAADAARAHSAKGAADARRTIARRFPIADAHAPLVAGILALHTERQLVGLAAILAQIEGDGKGLAVDAAMRLAFAHAVVPASRLATHPGRSAPLRIANGKLRQPAAGQWQERSPWQTFEDGFRLVRSLVQRLEAQAGATPFAARFVDDVKSLAPTPGSVVVRLGGASAWRTLAAEARDLAELRAPQLRLVLSQFPPRRTAESIAFEFHATAWALGRDAASLVPVDALLGPSSSPSWWSGAAALRPSLEAVEPLLRKDGRVVLLLDDDRPEALVAAALCGVASGFRVADADPGSVELIPPGAIPPPAPRTRANVALPAVPGGAGDPDLVPGPGLFSAPERYDARSFSAADAARTVTETAVAILRARGEPAPTTTLIGDIVVALDRAGHLRRLLAGGGNGGNGGNGGDGSNGGEGSQPDVVDRLVSIIRDELARPNRRRLVEVAPDHWWLAHEDDRDAAAAPLADRVEWAVYSLLSTSGSPSEPAFLARIGGLFQGHDRPEESLIRACLDSYRATTTTSEAVTTTEDLLARTHEHGLLLAALADGGHRLGMNVWIALREQSRRVGDRRLADSLDASERSTDVRGIATGYVDALESVDCIWYVPGRATFLFEVEWTAMIGETLLRRHARIPASDEVVRFLVVPAERTGLVRYKLEQSPLLRAAMEQGNWHVLKWSHVRDFLAADPLSLDGLEPYLGLDPAAERQDGQQLPLFVS